MSNALDFVNDAESPFRREQCGNVNVRLEVDRETYERPAVSSCVLHTEAGFLRTVLFGIPADELVAGFDVDTERVDDPAECNITSRG